jgi:hypothetical protein
LFREAELADDDASQRLISDIQAMFMATGDLLVSLPIWPWYKTKTYKKFETAMNGITNFVYDNMEEATKNGEFFNYLLLTAMFF